jgi:RNA polymerase sigma-32 factor
LVGVGSGALRSKLFFKLRRERTRIMNLLGDEDKADEALAVQFNVSKTQIANMVRRLETRDLSLDTLVSPDNDQESMMLGDERRDHVKQAVRLAVQDLDPRERYIVENRMMADAEDELSLAEIGRRLGVSRERARQLEERAKRKLRTRIREISRETGREVDLDTAA